MSTTERDLLAQAGVPADDPKVELAVFGREVEQFIDESPIGKYVVERAQADIEAAKTELLTVDPSDVAKIREIQGRAAIANSVRQWLREAITTGRNAAAILEQERDEHGGT